MFNNKKKDEPSDQRTIYKEREAPRFDLRAGISIQGFEGEGQLGNVSVTGCYLTSLTYVGIKPDEVYDVRIIPDPGEKIEPFNLKLKVTWTKSSENLFQAGFSLDKGQNNTHLKRYVGQLELHGVKPDYGNMSPERYIRD